MKKYLKELKDLIQEEYKFYLCLIILFIILIFPVNYYIVVGGGISDISSRIQVEQAYQSKGSFNISYVTELDGTVATYLLSFLMPKWERESVNDYKFTDNETPNDIQFRNELDLKTANSTAIYWAYTLANKDIKEVKKDLYVIARTKEIASSLKVGDIILSMDNNSFDSLEDYRNYINEKEIGDEITVRIKRKGKEREEKVTIQSLNDKKVIGVLLQYVKEYETSPTIKVKFKKDESGPSGGLISTLEIYNQLTKKDITHGLKIAGTGTIEEDGTIGNIGGITYKLLGAESSHADYFLAPSGNNYKEALKYKKKKNLKIKIIEAKSIEDVLKKLEELT